MVRKDFASIGPYSPDYEVDLPPSRFSSPPSAALVPFHRVNSTIRPPPNVPIAPLFSGDGTLMVTSTFGLFFHLFHSRTMFIMTPLKI